MYDDVFNPNPTGLYLNKQHFNFYCDPDNTVKQSVSDISEIYEFTFLDRNYLCIFNLREQSIESKYKCYNLFDITDINKIKQVSFPSIHYGDDSFGDFNNDNIIDFLTVINRKPGDFKQKITGTAYMVRTYTFNNGKSQALCNDSIKLPYYIYALCDENMDNFKVLQCDWMIPLQDSTGKVLESMPYTTHWTVFEPSDNNVENSEGQKNKKYSVCIGWFDEIEGANTICRELKNKKIDVECGEIFIQMDEFKNDTKWLVLIGNYAIKKEAQETLKKLRKLGYSPEIVDFRKGY
jgi:hypothetical protein